MNDKKQYEPLSFSSLKAFSRSPLQFLEYKAKKSKPTPAMEFGTLVHRSVLEPDKYADSVAIWEGRRAGKNYEAFCSLHINKDVITPQRALEVKECQTRLQEHPLAGGLLEDLDKTEVEFTINHLGLPHRGFIDGILPWAIVDLKVTKAVDHYSLQKTIWQYKYHMQAAIYERAAVLMGYEPEAYFIIAVESAPPYHVAVVELEPHYIARGHLEWEGLLQVYKDWDGSPLHQHGKEIAAELMDAPSWVPPLDFEG